MGLQSLRLRTDPEGVSVTAAETIIQWFSTKHGGAFNHINTGNKKIQEITFRFAVADINLNSLKVWGKVHEDDSVFVPIALDAADYTTAGEFVKFARVYTAANVEVDSDLMNIDATQYGLLVLVCPGFEEIKITATTAAGTAKVTAWLHGTDAPIFTA